MASGDGREGASGDPGMGNSTGDADEAHRTSEYDVEPEMLLLHDTEHALEWLQRARGHLLAFHHAVGHAMDKLAVVESELRAEGHDDLADRVRDDLLPAGVIDSGAWSYEVVEEFQAGPLADVERFEAAVRERVAGGERHVAERAQQERWRDRAER